MPSNILYWLKKYKLISNTDYFNAILNINCFVLHYNRTFFFLLSEVLDHSLGITVVRHPFVRVLSAYQSKVIDYYWFTGRYFKTSFFSSIFPKGVVKVIHT